jgi:hypothetical protein
MWGQNWGQMVWGGVNAVPAISVWGLLLLGGLLAILGLRQIKARPRTIGLAALVLLFAIPLTAKALSLPFAFTNGTVADASQVNADFAALAKGPQVYMNRNFQSVALAPSPGVTVATLSLPAGSYILYVKLRYEGTGTMMQPGQGCVFQGVGIGGLDSSEGNVPTGGELTGQVDGVMMDTVTKNAGAAADVHVQCFGDPSVHVINSQFVALPSQITVQ